MIRRAAPHERVVVEAIVREAYEHYIARIGKPPGPMLDDYAVLIADGAVSVLEEPDGAIAAIIVLLPKSDHLLLDNSAVRKDRQGQGLGRRLICLCRGRRATPRLQRTAALHACDDDREHCALYAARLCRDRPRSRRGL